MAEARPRNPGVLRVITGTDPAANTEITETVPAGKIWRLISVRFNFTTDGTVATRKIRLDFSDGTSVFARFPSSTTVAASSTNTYTFAIGASATNDGAGTASVAIADTLLEPGYKFLTATASIQATDNYAAPVYQIEEWDA